MRISATIRNSVPQGLKAYSEQIAAKVQAAVDAAAVVVKNRSQELVPVDTGALHDSCTVESTGEGYNRVAKVRYNTPYALHVHEDLTANHPNGGQAKYLEQALRESVTEVLSTAAEALR